MSAGMQGGAAIGGRLVMDRLALVERLRAHEPELRANGILSLSVCGSAARGDDTVASDVDLAGPDRPGRPDVTPQVRQPARGSSMRDVLPFFA